MTTKPTTPAVHHELEHSRTDDAYCPYCLHVVSYAFLLDDSDEIECEQCEKPFEVYRNVEVTYTTKKIKENDTA